MVKVPFAILADGEVGFPQTAARDRDWLCPDPLCTRQVVVKRGTILTPHFAHKSASSCGGESLTHRATKEWIRVSLSSPGFVIKADCDTCITEFVAFRGGPSYTGQCEVPCGTYKIDVAAAGTSTTAGVAVEVYHTHKTETTKMKDLMAASLCNAFEVKAVDLVVSDYPTTFQSVRPLRCKLCLLSAVKSRCEQARRRRLIITRRFGRRWHANVVKIAAARASKFGQRWLFLARYKTVAARVKKLHDKDEADRVHTCAGCKRPLETYTWVYDADALWGYSRLSESYVTENIPNRTPPLLVYHPKCSPLYTTCNEATHFGRWCACERRKRRPCGSCKKWGFMDDMHSFDTPGRGKARARSDDSQEWVCGCCGVECRQCGDVVSKEQAKYGGKCFSCNSANKRRRCD